MKLLVLQVRSGLGNQLFQFAAGYHFAQRYDYQLVLSPAWYPGPVKRWLKKLLGQEVREFSLLAMLGQHFPVLSTAEVNRRLKNGNLIQVAEENVEQTWFEELTAGGRDIVLTGYWQRAVYPLKRLDSLGAMIRPQFRLSNSYEKVLATVTPDHVAIHIRRGDFLSNKAFGACTLDYYLQAIERILLVIPSPKFIVVTNDTSWVRANLTAIPFTLFTSTAGRYRDLEEFFLLSQFRNMILANSTFSWWAAILGGVNGRQLYCPTRWFLQPELQEHVHDLLLPEWIAIPNELEAAPSTR